jgi:hypothetical protein
MKVGLVITYTRGREENVELALHDALHALDRPDAVALVLDGCDTEMVRIPGDRRPMVPTVFKRIPKHVPGREQPRNVGVRLLRDFWPQLTHAWFLDSDILVLGALEAYRQAAERFGEDAVMIGPYEWMDPGRRVPQPELYNDYRWAMFRERSGQRWVADLGVALGCFGGNLLWPIDRFIEVGGFHAHLYHGRCEDGELGLRAAAARVPMVLVPGARGWHMDHPRNLELIQQRNARDVPLINQWHPWVHEKGFVVTEQDGRRFEFDCACGQRINTGEMWQHFSLHQAEGDPPDLTLR